MVDWDGLENRRWCKPIRGFESHPLRCARILMVSGCFSSSSVKAMLVVGPSSRRILRAMSMFVGASMLKWFAPFTGRKRTFGLVEAAAIACNDPRLLG